MRVVRYFPEADLRSGHLGLIKYAKKHGVDCRTLGIGEYVIFVNREQNKVKMMVGSQMVAYLRLEKGKVDPRTIALMPNYFEGTEIRYDKALREVLEKDFKPIILKRSHSRNSKQIEADL